MKKISLIVLLTFLIFSCSKTTDKEYLDLSQKLIKEKNATEAITNLNTLLKEYPESKLAPKALVHLASIYQNLMVKDISEEESYNQAQKYFREVFDKYPNSEDAPNSLFMSSFILSNNLQKFDEATVSYKLFIEKFPDNPLAVSAKQELDNMGISPEDILKKNEVANN